LIQLAARQPSKPYYGTAVKPTKSIQEFSVYADSGYFLIFFSVSLT
jgi:hypothetical protein